MYKVSDRYCFVALLRGILKGVKKTILSVSDTEGMVSYLFFKKPSLFRDSFFRLAFRYTANTNRFVVVYQFYTCFPPYSK